MLATCVFVVVRVSDATDALDDAISQEENGMIQVTQRDRIFNEVTERVRSGRQESLPEFLARAAKVLGGEPDHTTCWTSGDSTYTVEVWCLPGETAQDCEDRFNEAVALLQETFPNEGPCE